ncbi:hypothetical protein ALC60_02461 [Trachymyrmex zeteki]|uniref:Uncharacterized protein n=1 Tax=Mycetomoellerius zeteki TaxID=64791 RepID=A0A151XEL2_9HYME|nr:hypothetical protein ALC60_02461 [Trachymyrmex zeteki]
MHPRRFINANPRHSLLFSSFRPPPEGEEEVSIGSVSVSSHAGRTLRGGPKIPTDRKGQVRSQKEVDIVIKTIARPTVRVELFILSRWRWPRGREAGSQHNVQETKYTGWSEFAAGRNFIYTYSEPPS